MNTTTPATLILRLEGPLQAWGAPGARWEQRPTMDRPTKSGVAGLLANALGRNHEDPIDDLAALTYSVRADRPGLLTTDYQTAGGGTFPLDALTTLHNHPLAEHPERFTYGAPRDPQTRDDGTRTAAWDTGRSRQTVVKQAGMLTDAAFLAAFTGDRGLIDTLAEAVQRPARYLSLGRRAFPPCKPLLHDVTDHADYTWMLDLPPLERHAPVIRGWHEVPPGTTGIIALPEQPGTHAPLSLATLTITPGSENTP